MASSSRPTGNNNHPNRQPTNGTRGRALDEGPRRLKGRSPRSVSHHTASNSDTYRPRWTNSNNHRYNHSNTKKNGREEPRRGQKEQGWQQVGQDRWGDLLAELHRVTEMLGQLTRQLQARAPTQRRDTEWDPPPLRDDNLWPPTRQAAKQGSRSIGLTAPSRNPQPTAETKRQRGGTSNTPTRERSFRGPRTHGTQTNRRVLGKATVETQS